MMKIYPDTRRAFTLVELLVVIAIISVLAAMLMPALEKAIESANQIACSSNLKQLALASQFYADENKNYLPNSSQCFGNPPWPPMLMPYLDMELTTTQPTGGAFKCPSNGYLTSASKPTASYGMNLQGLLYHGYYTPGWSMGQPGCCDYRIDRVSHPNAYVVLGDNNNRDRAYYYQWLLTYDNFTSNPFKAHGEGGNLFWVDLHVSWQSQDELVAYKWYWMFHSWKGCDSPFTPNCPPPAG